MSWNFLIPSTRRARAFAFKMEAPSLASSGCDRRAKSRAVKEDISRGEFGWRGGTNFPLSFLLLARGSTFWWETFIFLWCNNNVTGTNKITCKCNYWSYCDLLRDHPYFPFIFPLYFLIDRRAQNSAKLSLSVRRGGLEHHFENNIYDQSLVKLSNDIRVST